MLVNAPKSVSPGGVHLSDPGAPVNGAVVVAGCAVHDYAHLCDVAYGSRRRADGVH